MLRHRRLLLLALVALLSVFIAQALPHGAKAVCLWIVLGAAILLLALTPWRRKLLTAALALLLAALALFSSYRISRTEEHLRPYDGEALYLSATLYEITERTETEIRGVGELLLVTEDGQKINARVRVFAPTAAVAGDVLYGSATLHLTKESDSYAKAAGLYGSLSFHFCRTVDHRTGLRYTIGALRQGLAERIRAAVPREEGELLAALLLGERDGLSDAFTRDMTRIGTTHILSLSGLHLAILTGGLGMLLQRLRLGKRLRLLILLFFSLAFIAFTGFSPSVMRAGFMLSFSILPQLLREERDSLSSLGAAVALICLLTPYAVGDIGLWLSALSTLGILLLFDRMRQREGADTVARRVLHRLLIAFAVTVAASVATLPLTLTLYGTLPLLSPLSNLLLGPLTQLALYAALAVAILGAFPPVAAVARLLCSLTIRLAHALGEIPKTVIAVRSTLALVLIFLLVGAFLFYFLFCPRKKFRLRVPILLCVAILLTATLPPLVARIAYADRLSLLYTADETERTDCLYFEHGGARLMIVLSDFERMGNAEHRAVKEAAGELDAFLIPYYTAGTLAYAEQLLTRERVRRLYLPAPETPGEWQIYDTLLTLSAEAKTATVAFPRSEAFSFEGLSVARLYPMDRGGVMSGVFLEVRFGSTSVQYYSGDALGAPMKDTAKAADVLILGRHRSISEPSLSREDYAASDAILVCADPKSLPFDVSEGVRFSYRQRVLLD